MDAKSAFVNGDFKEEAYMQQHRAPSKILEADVQK